MGWYTFDHNRDLAMITIAFWFLLLAFAIIISLLALLSDAWVKSTARNHGRFPGLQHLAGCSNAVSVQPERSEIAHPITVVFACSSWNGGTHQLKRSLEHNKLYHRHPLPLPQSPLPMACSCQTIPQSALFAERSAQILQWLLYQAMFTAIHVYLAALTSTDAVQ